MVKRIIYTGLLASVLFLYSTCIIPGESGSSPNIIDHHYRDITNLSAAEITRAKDTLHIAYQHTSHGSQLITGMNCLETYPDFGTTFSWDDAGAAGNLDLDNDGIPGCADLSQGDSADANGDTLWVVATRALLDNPSNSHINVVVWSWCSINGHNARRYVDNMEKLIAEYPDIVFVFMTGHAEGQSEDLTPNSVHYNNELIREHCRENDRILYDFADIEAYNPDNEYFWNQDMADNLNYSGGNWAVQWIAANPDAQLTRLAMGTGDYTGCAGCAHSDIPAEANLNCILKAQAAWQLWVHISENVL